MVAVKQLPIRILILAEGGVEMLSVARHSQAATGTAGVWFYLVIVHLEF